jgi:RNA-directed DNA polymerase
MSLVRDLATALEMSEDDISRIIYTAPRRYKIFAVPKRSGLGHRIIAQPARELKAIQRYVIAEKLRGLRLHPIAMAYRTGKSIADNAAQHANKRVILKLDFRDFFHSITPRDLQAAIDQANFSGIAKEDRVLLNNILFWHHPTEHKMCLSIGAPSSPFISNFVMESLDREFYKVARSFSVICTRYADDITLSANSIENLLKAEREIRRIISRTKRPRLTFNEEKRGIFTTAGRRIVTGLVLTPEGKVSLGRDRKRKISAALHHISIGRNVAQEHMQRTRGWLAYANSVEPTFAASMQRKYPALFRQLMSMPVNAE